MTDSDPRRDDTRRDGDGGPRSELRRLGWSLAFFLLVAVGYAALWQIGLFH